MAGDDPLHAGALIGTVRRTVTSVVFTIAGLSFAFGFGNGLALGIRLGVPRWIAPLIAPAVDLSVVALLASIQLLRAHGRGGHLIGPRLLLVLCGGITFALNTAQPILTGQTGRACFDAVAPVLLIGWSEVGPRLLALLHTTRTDDGPAVVSVRDGSPADPVDGLPGSAAGHAALAAPPAAAAVATTVGPQLGGVPDEDGTVRDGPAVPAALLARARQADARHRARYGRGITRDALRARLKVSNAVAGAALRELRNSAGEATK